MTKIEAIVSDSDGTLVNTLDLITHGQYETARQYLIRYGLLPEEIPDFDTYSDFLTRAIGGSARTTLEQTLRLIYANSPHHLEKMDFDELHDMLNPIQDKIAPEYVKPYDHLVDLLEIIGQTGIKFALFTSGTPHHIVRNFGVALPELAIGQLYKDNSQTDKEKMMILTTAMQQRFGIKNFVVITADDTEKHKPDPQSLNLAMERLEVERSTALVLGDHRVDMQTAINAGVTTRVGITHGFDDRNTLEAAGATHIIDELDELKEFIV